MSIHARLSWIAFAGLLLLATPASTQEEEAEYSRAGADSCLACHDDQLTLALFAGPHAVPSDPRGPFGHGQLQCESCHGPGGEHAGRVRRGQDRPPVTINFGASSGTAIEAQNEACLGCHSGDAVAAWHAGPHDNGEVACADCHTSHAGRDPVADTATQAEVCYDCHQEQRGQMLRAFTHPLFEGKMDCSGCHGSHAEPATTAFSAITPNDTCNGCHAEKRGPYLWEHAPVSEDCGLCHAPHGSNQPGMLTRRAPLLCQSCHSQSGHPSFAYDTEGLPEGMPSQFLLAEGCLNCHGQVHGSNHPSGSGLMR